MARVDYSGVPEVSAETQAPDDLQRVEASPEAFGAPLARGLEELGQGATKLSDFYGQVAADNATNNFLDQRAKLLYGDPSKHTIGPDGQPVQDSGFFGLRGADAMKAAPDVQRRLDELVQQERANLQTPLARQQYDVDTRRYRAQSLSEIGSYTDNQQKAWAKDTNDTAALIAGNSLSRNPNDPQTIADATDAIRKSYVRNAQIQGENPEGARLKADQFVAQKRVDALLPNDAIGAERTLKENEGLLSSLPNYDFLAYRVADRADAARAQRISDILLGNGSAPGASPPPLGASPVAPGAAPGPQPSPAAPSAAGSAAMMSPQNNIGNVRGAGGPFAQPATPVDGVILAANTLRSGYRGLTLSQIAAKWAPAQDHNDPAAWAKTVSRESGVAVNAVPNLDDASTMQKLVAGIGVAEKRPSELGAFTAPVIQEGVTAALGGRHAQLTAGAPRGQSDVDALLADVPPERRTAVMDAAIGRVHETILRAKELNATTDDPDLTVQLWHAVDTGGVSLDNIRAAQAAGKIKPETAIEMTRALDTRQTEVGKNAFGVLKTALSGGAIEAGQMSIFPKEDQARAQTNWAEAQSEWYRRTGPGSNEDPTQVLSDMVPRYAPQVRKPNWLPPLRLQARDPRTVEDVNAIAVQTYQMRQLGKITQEHYDEQVHLLNLYKEFFTLQQRSDQARAAAAAGGKPGGKAAPGGGGAIVTPEPTQ